MFWLEGLCRLWTTFLHPQKEKNIDVLNAVFNQQKHFKGNGGRAKCHQNWDCGVFFSCCHCGYLIETAGCCLFVPYHSFLSRNTMYHDRKAFHCFCTLQGGVIGSCCTVSTGYCIKMEIVRLLTSTRNFLIGSV